MAGCCRTSTASLATAWGRTLTDVDESFVDGESIGYARESYSYTEGFDLYTSRLVEQRDDADTPVEIFDIHGCRVEKPTVAGIYIVRQGAKTRKVIVK